jgi:transposase
MERPETEDFYFYQPEDQSAIAPLLSDESFSNLQAEISRLKKDSPPGSGLGINHPHYIPRTLDQCQQKIESLQQRYNWSRRLGFLIEISERDAQRRLRQLCKENQQLKEQNDELKNEILRTRQQLQSLLGVKKRKPKKAVNTDKDQMPATQTKKRGAPLGHIGKTRPIPDKVGDHQIIAPPDICPHCGGTDIVLEDDFVSKYIEDIAPVVKTVTEQLYQWASCTHCGKPVIAKQATPGPAVTIGPNLVTLLTVLRQLMGVSYRKLSQLCSETLQIQLSAPAVMGIINRFSQKCEPIYKGIEASLPTQPVLHGDETGWRMDGNPWQLWCFCNRSLAYFHLDPSRGAKVPKAILGEDYNGILHADFYAAYNFLPNVQRCLIHFLRAIKDELEITPEDQSLSLLKDGIKSIIEKGTQLKALGHARLQNAGRQQLEDKLEKLAKLRSDNKKTNTLIKRLVRHQHELIRFVDHPQAEYHNNRAERALRPEVIFRKMSFGNRTPAGAYNFQILATVLQTCRLKRKNLTDFIRAVWLTPKDQLLQLTRSLLDTS